jgi:folate-binding protein YgfZ
LPLAGFLSLCCETCIRVSAKSVNPAGSSHPGTPGAAGDFLRDQKHIAEGTALIHDSSLAVITVSGPDRLSWLNSLISQDVLVLSPGETVESLVLNPQGRVQHSFLLTDDHTRTWLLTPVIGCVALEEWLNSMVFRMDVVVERPQGYEILSTPHRRLLDSVNPTVVFKDPWPHVGAGSMGYAKDVHPGHQWSWCIALVDAAHLSALTMPLVGPDAMTALSIAAARPTMADVDEKTLPHELDWLRTAVHLDKGCYRGQEAVAKVHNLGHPPRRVTLLHLDGSESLLPRAGDEVFAGEKKVGHITRAAWHYELGPIALAMVKRTTPVELTLTVMTGGREVAANQEVIVPPDAGATRDIPRLGRLR